MMDRFGVSCTVLREALKTLEAKGPVEARAKVGTRVLPQSRRNLLDRQILTWKPESGPSAEFLAAFRLVREGLELQAAPPGGTEPPGGPCPPAVLPAEPAQRHDPSARALCPGRVRAAPRHCGSPGQSVPAGRVGAAGIRHRACRAIAADAGSLCPAGRPGRRDRLHRQCRLFQLAEACWRVKNSAMRPISTQVSAK
ncbi:GntR family transcriptional regulator [Rhodobacter calidifons]